jgi:hypothetical protein
MAGGKSWKKDERNQWEKKQNSTQAHYAGRAFQGDRRLLLVLSGLFRLLLTLVIVDAVRDGRATKTDVLSLGHWNAMGTAGDE